MDLARSRNCTLLCQRRALVSARGISGFHRVSIPGKSKGSNEDVEHCFISAIDPTYRSRLQSFAVARQWSEDCLYITYAQEFFALADSTGPSLCQPTYTAADLGCEPPHRGVMVNSRTAPQMTEFGLLGATPTAETTALSDPGIASGDGISRDANIV